MDSGNDDTLGISPLSTVKSIEVSEIPTASSRSAITFSSPPAGCDITSSVMF